MSTHSATRREFLQQSAAAASAVALGGAAARAAATAAQPAAKPAGGRKRPKLGLYTITYLGVWYRGRGLTMEEVIERAERFGYEGIEIEGKRPHGNPLDWPKPRCAEVRKRAEDHGVPIYAISGLNDFSTPIVEQREAQLVWVREQLRMASELGAKWLRVFLSWPGVSRHPQLASYEIGRQIWDTAHKSIPPEDTWAHCRDCLAESAKYAGDFGVTLALQNHKPIITSYKDVLRMIKEVNSPHLKACIDGVIEPNAEREDYIVPAMKEVGDLQVLCHWGGDYYRGPDGKITGGERLSYWVKGLAEIGYTGYIGYELCHPLPKVNGETVGIEFADQCADLAVQQIREFIEKHYSEKNTA